MKAGKLRLTSLSLMVAGSMLLAACGGETGTTTTPTSVVGPTDTTAPAAAATDTTAPAAATDTSMPAAGSPTSGTSSGTPSTSGTSAPSGGIIKIGVDLPLSGGDATDGLPTRNGMELAVRQVNAAGGVTIAGTTYQLQLYVLDDVPPGGQQHDPAQSSKNADAFISDPDVMVMLGPFNSANAIAMMPKLNTAGLCQISPSNTNKTLTKPQFGQLATLRPTGKVTYFRVVTTDDIQGPAAADYAYDKLGFRKVYVLDDTEAYGKGLADDFEKEFKSKGGTSLGHDGVPNKTTDFSSIMTKVAGTGPDFVYYGGTSSNGIPLARKQMKSAGLNVPLMGGDGIVDAEFIKVAGPDAAGAYGTVPSPNAEKLPEAQQFIKDYNAAGFKEPLGAYSAPGYETASIAIDAMKRATAKTRDAECVALRNTKDFKGVLGTTSFDENGDTTNRVLTFYTVKNNDKGVLDWVFVDTIRFGGQ